MFINLCWSGYIVLFYDFRGFCNVYNMNFLILEDFVIYIIWIFNEWNFLDNCINYFISSEFLIFVDYIWDY